MSIHVRNTTLCCKKRVTKNKYRPALAAITTMSMAWSTRMHAFVEVTPINGIARAERCCICGELQERTPLNT